MTLLEVPGLATTLSAPFGAELKTCLPSGGRVCVTLGVIGMLLHLFYCRGTQHFTGTVSNEATSEMGYPAWPAGRTCEFSFLSAWHEAKPRTSLGRQVRPSSLCRFVVALRLWPLFLLRPPGSDGPYWYS